MAKPESKEESNWLWKRGKRGWKSHLRSLPFIKRQINRTRRRITKTLIKSVKTIEGRLTELPGAVLRLVSAAQKRYSIDMEDNLKQQILEILQWEKEARSKALSGPMEPFQTYAYIAGFTESTLAQIEQLLD